MLSSTERRSVSTAEERLLTVPEAAGYLRVSVATVYRLLRRGAMPGVKVGKSWRIPQATLDAYLGATHPSTGPPEAQREQCR